MISLTCALLLLAPLHVAQVHAITIHSVVGSLGHGGSYDAKIVRHDGVFIRNDGVVIPNARISALLDAINAPTVGSISEADSKNVRASLLAHVQDEESVYLGSAAHLSDVRSDFERQFEDAERFQSWMSPRFSGFMSDYYPQVEVTIDASGRRIELSTHSQWPFMLPILVSEGSAGRRTFNPALSMAVGALMPRVVNECHLAGCGVYDLWATHVLEEPAIATRVARAAASPSEVDSIAKGFGLAFSYNAKQQVVTGIREAWAWFPAFPRIRAEFSLRWNYENADYSAILAYARRALVAFSKSWVGRHMNRRDRVELWELSIVDARQADFRGDYVRGFRHDREMHAAACLERDRLTHFYDIDIKGPDAARLGDWILLENGDLILQQAAPGEALPEGSILRTDGSAEFPSSSQPC